MEANKNSHKKLTELELLRLHYASNEYEVIKTGESPDFVLKDSNGRVFGVEVTEHFADETSARLKKMPNYADKVINKKYIDKDDIKTLEIINTEYQAPNGDWVPLGPAVMRANLPYPSNIEPLKVTIAKKNALFHKYDPTLKQIDLLVIDWGDLGIITERLNTFSHLYQQSVANTLVSPFANIILIVIDGPDRFNTFYLKSS